MLIFNLNFECSVQATQRFSEFYMRESLNNKDLHQHLSFTKEASLVEELILLLSPDSAIQIKKYFPEGLFFVFSWIITFFTHNIESMEIQQRLLDYVICSHPGSIYFLCAVAMVEIFGVFRRELNCNYDSTGEVYSYFQKINYSHIDFDEIIVKTEIFKNEFYKNTGTLSLLSLLELNKNIKDKFIFGSFCNCRKKTKINDIEWLNEVKKRLI